MKAAGITKEEMDAFERDPNDTAPEGDEDDEEGTPSDTTEDEEPDTKSARERLEARRAGRKPSDDEDQPPHDASGKPRGSDGSPSDSGKGTPQDGEVLQDAVDNTPAGMARMRRELREAAREVVTTQPSTATQPSEAANAKAAKRTLEELGPEPDENEDLAGNLIWNRERNNIVLEEIQADRIRERANGLFTSALQEVEEMGEAYSKVQPDYKKAIDHAEREYSRAIKLMMPATTDAQIAAALKKERINLAIKCEQEGTNVAEVLYDLAIERFGYNPEAESSEPAPTPAATSKAAPTKSNLSTVARNQRRSASPLDGGGQSGKPRITLEQAALMSPLELMSLPQEDISYLESMGL
jgi:hypothetical protein